MKRGPYGPVLPDLYHKIKKEQGICIKEPIDINAARTTLSDEDQAILDRILEIYEDKDGWDLSILTHEPDSPWTKTVAQFGLYSVIKTSFITEYYTQFVG